MKPSPTSRTEPAAEKAEHKILFQTYFKSLGPRTYASQMKEASNGNHYLVLTEGRRDEETDEVKKSRVFVFSEDFGAFFRMLQETAQFIKGHPVPDEVRKRRQKFWEKRAAQAPAAPAAVQESVPPAPPVRKPYAPARSAPPKAQRNDGPRKRGR